MGAETNSTVVSHSVDVAQRLAVISIGASAVLAVANVATGLLSHSTSVTAAGLEFAGDVLASFIVYLGIVIAARPPDEDHPYGHGRFEILAGLLVGIVLLIAGFGICFTSAQRLHEGRITPLLFGIWAPLTSIFVKGWLAAAKFRVGRRLSSAALIADGWNDTIDILSALTALCGLALALHDPTRFVHADSIGGLAVGVIVVVTGLRVVRDASLELTDTMPSPGRLDEIRKTAMQVQGVHGVEKCYARKTGFRYHVDLHIEVDPRLTVADSHYLAHQVQDHILAALSYVAAVLVHVEPDPEKLRALRE